MSENQNPEWSSIPDPQQPQQPQDGPYQQSAGPQGQPGQQGPYQQPGYQWTPPQNARARGPQANSFFNTMRRSGFFRSTQRVLGGVCGGLAAKTGWDVSLIRIVWAVLTLPFTFLSVVAYVAAWILLPNQADGTILLEDWTRG